MVYTKTDIKKKKRVNENRVLLESICFKTKLSINLVNKLDK